MKNKINKVITLETGKKYFVMKQAIYKSENYYLVAEVNEDESDIKDKFAMVHEFEKDGSEYLEMVQDQKTMQVLLSHLNFEEE